jgi:hypothetical protein
MAIPKRKNADAVVPHVYEETSDKYIPASLSTPMPVADYSTIYPPIIDTTTTANTIYFGFVAVGSSASTSSAIWRIMRMVDSSGIYTFSFADGNTNFDNVWNNRATTVMYS